MNDVIRIVPVAALSPSMWSRVVAIGATSQPILCVTPRQKLQTVEAFAYSYAAATSERGRS